jgi:hypothetical protein
MQHCMKYGHLGFVHPLNCNSLQLHVMLHLIMAVWRYMQDWEGAPMHTMNN